MSRKLTAPRSSSTSWDAVADWYAGWVGPDGSKYHRTLAIPLLLSLLDGQGDMQVADLGCGPGILAPHIAQAGGRLTGIDLSPKLIALARRHHGQHGRFLVGDVTRLTAMPALKPASFDVATFLLSLQDIDPLAAALKSAAWLIKPGGRLAIVMLHPCFRIPRQSGWGWDEKRALQYRRLDTYLSPLAVPMQSYGRQRQGTTRSYHRPLGVYAAALKDAGFIISDIREVTDSTITAGTKAARRAVGEFPLFLGLAAHRVAADK